MGKRLTIEAMRRLANERGGRCLSDIYINSRKELLWQCKENHTWKVKARKVIGGSWCPICSARFSSSKRKIPKIGSGYSTKKKTIEDMQQLAKLYDGECLSSLYVNNNTKLEWRCKKEHTWFAIPRVVSSGSWCPSCGWRKRSIEEMKNLAKERNGLCLSTVYQSVDHHLEWQCEYGHIWKAVPGSVLKGHWCAKCAHAATRAKTSHTTRKALRKMRF